MSSKNILHVVGQTPKGLLVIGGVYSFYETYGVPLSLIFDSLFKDDCIPDWMEMISSMIQAGKSLERSISFIKEQIADSEYPLEHKNYAYSKFDEILNQSK